MTSAIGQSDILLGKYAVERVLGRGGMGVVYAVRHISLGELFAMKVLLPDAADSLKAGERFLREAKAAARLKSEHVVKVHDVDRLDTGELYMVMEHLVGADLKTLLAEHGPLPTDDAVELILQACDCIAEAHAAGIVHRDIKPGNLFLTQRASGAPCIKVLDFGISKQTLVDAPNLTESRVMLGTPSYMSPEQVQNSKRTDARTDVWSLGVVLYELIAGRKPFQAHTMAGVITRVLTGSPKPLSAVARGVPPALDAIVRRCLEKSIDARFQSVAELADALRLAARSPIATSADASPMDVTRTLEYIPAPPLPGESTTLTLEETTRRIPPRAPDPPPPPLPAPGASPSRPLIFVGDSKSAELPVHPSPTPARERARSIMIAAAVALALGLGGAAVYVSSLFR